MWDFLPPMNTARRGCGVTLYQSESSNNGSYFLTCRYNIMFFRQVIRRWWLGWYPVPVYDRSIWFRDQFLVAWSVHDFMSGKHQRHRHRWQAICCWWLFRSVFQQQWMKCAVFIWNLILFAGKVFLNSVEYLDSESMEWTTFVNRSSAEDTRSEINAFSRRESQSTLPPVDEENMEEKIPGSQADSSGCESDEHSS